MFTNSGKKKSAEGSGKSLSGLSSFLQVTGFPESPGLQFRREIGFFQYKAGGYRYEMSIFWYKVKYSGSIPAQSFVWNAANW